jgi:hypothetical protein
MAFIRTKEIPPGSGNLYKYEVESYREGGHVRQRVLHYIGSAGHTAATGVKLKAEMEAYPITPATTNQHTSEGILSDKDLNITFKPRWYLPLTLKLTQKQIRRLDELSILDNLSDKEKKEYDKLKKVDKPILKLPDAINAPSLFERYPELREVRIMEPFGDALGAYYQGNINTQLNDSPFMIPHLIHEITHAVQDIKHLPGGAAYFGPAKGTEYDTYINSPGENQARDAQSRSAVMSRSLGTTKLKGENEI